MSGKRGFYSGAALVFLISAVIGCAEGLLFAEIKVHPLYEPEFGSRGQGWEKVPAGLHGSFGSIDRRYDKYEVPQIDDKMSVSATAWRGERLSVQVVLWTSDGSEQVRFSSRPLCNEDGAELGAESVYPRFVRYVLADEPREDGCGPRPKNNPYKLAADVLDTAEILDMPGASVRCIWVTMDIPAQAPTGRFKGQVKVEAKGGKKLVFEINVDVLPLVLPEPPAWGFHLDLWQNPYSVARYHNVKAWSAEHWGLLKPLIRMLAGAGQKCITTSIIHQPWGGQTYEPFEAMIEWVKDGEGNWSYDYGVFDRWVEFCIRCGITRQINCYSMVPWGNRFRYMDKQSGDYLTLELEPGTKEYEEHWRGFLKDFVKHLRKRGWLERTTIAMDERPLGVMQKLIKFMKDAAPELKITLAGNCHDEIKFDIYDYCVYLSPAPDPNFLSERSARSLPTTFYVCCKPQRPNIFANSPPAEGVWLGWHAAAKGYTGFLRWAYNSWVADPLYDTNYTKWVAGDCFLVYPGARSSIRFERLREGIADYEKIRVLKKILRGEKNERGADWQKRLDALLTGFDFELVKQVPCSKTVSDAKRVLTELSREVTFR